jgi:hypothetical protein
MGDDDNANGIRRTMIRLTVLLITCSVLPGAGGGCVSVTPPKTPPKDPVYVYVTDYGIHSSVVLPLTDDGLYVEYAFGDYGYAALNRDSPIDAIGALFFSFGSGFGRQLTRVAPGDEAPTLVYAPNAITRIPAERELVKKALSELSSRYEANTGKIVHNEITQIDWKRDKQHYSALNNCNQLTAEQLRTLGYGVKGFPLFSAFHVPGGEKVKVKAIKDATKSPGGMSGSR